MRKAYIIINIITAFIDERFFKLSDYHAKQLIKYLHQRFTVYQNEKICFLFDEFNIIIDVSKCNIYKLLVKRK